MRPDVQTNAPAQRTFEPVTGPRTVASMAREAELKLRPTVYVPSLALRVPIPQPHWA